MYMQQINIKENPCMKSHRTYLGHVQFG